MKIWRVGAPLVAALVASLPGIAQESTHEDKPAPDSVEDLDGPLRSAFRRAFVQEPLFPQLREFLEPLPPFFSDTQMTLKLRSYYYDRKDSDASDAYAATYGGSLAYRSGWLLDTFAVGAEGYTSQRIAGRNEEVTLLLDGDEGIAVLGQAYGQLRYAEQYLTLYRQRLDLPYVNARDNRMIPNTFEAYTLSGKISEKFDYTGGYVAKIKPRGEDQFTTMSEHAAGGSGTGSKGLVMAGFLWAPLEHFHIGAINHFVEDNINVFYAESEYVQPLTDLISLRFGLQFSDQRSVGKDLLTGSSFDTRSAGAQFAFGFQHAILRVAFSTTDSEQRIRSPWGSNPGYITLMQRNFNRAGEDAWLVGLSYDFKKWGIEGLSAFVNYAEGNSARNAQTSERLPDQREVDLTLDYRFQQKWLRGLWIRARGSFLHREDDSDVTNIRVIVNYEFPVF